MSQFVRCPLDGAITLLFGSDGMRLEVRDELSHQTFLYVEVSADRVSDMLSRLCSIPCKFGMYAPDRIGLKAEHKEFTFEMPPAEYKNRREIAAKEAERLCPEGWVADSDFNSQGSFFKKGEVEMARTIIRRWVAP